MSITISGTTTAGASAVTGRDAASVAVPGKDAGAQSPAVAAGSDKVTLGATAPSNDTYDKPRIKPAPSAADLDAMIAEGDRQAQAVMDLILPLVEQQGLSLAKLVSGEQHLSADPATIEKAKADIADDGEFGVKQVADRILNFVKSASGGDPTRMAALRDAVEEGFKQAADIFGGKLPEISEKTRTVIMDTFDRWASEASGKVDNAPAAQPDGAPSAKVDPKSV